MPSLSRRHLLKTGLAGGLALATPPVARAQTTLKVVWMGWPDNQVLPLMATGRLGRAQLAALARILAQLSAEQAFRVLLIHHPLHSNSRVKRLTDSMELRALLSQHGVDFILHGHDHIHSTMWFEGPKAKIPAIGVPSDSALAHRHYPAAAYNLFSIAREGETWRLEQSVRGFGDHGRIEDLQQVRLS